MRRKGTFFKLVIFAVTVAIVSSVAGQTIPRPEATEQYNVGIAHIAASRWQAASEAFQQAIKLDPNDADAYFQLGYSLMQLDRPAEAISHRHTAFGPQCHLFV